MAEPRTEPPNDDDIHQYTAGDVVYCDGWRWQCYCHDGPPVDWENDPKGAMVECMSCKEVYGHLACYGYQDFVPPSSLLLDILTMTACMQSYVLNILLLI